MKTPEHNEQAALFNWAKYYETKCKLLKMMFAIPNGGHRHKAVAAKMKAEGVKAGVPDIFLAVQWSVCGIPIPGLFIEMKIGKNKPTQSQAEWIRKLEEGGYQCKVCYSWIDAAFVICDYLELDPELYGLEELK